MTPLPGRADRRADRAAPGSASRSSTSTTATSTSTSAWRRSTASPPRTTSAGPSPRSSRDVAARVEARRAGARRRRRVVGSTFAGDDLRARACGSGRRATCRSRSTTGPAPRVIAMDVTERYEAVVTSRRRLRQQTALADLGQLALRETDLVDGHGRGDRARRGASWARSGPGCSCSRRRATSWSCWPAAGFPPGLVGRMTAAYGADSQAGYTLMADGAGDHRRHARARSGSRTRAGCSTSACAARSPSRSPAGTSRSASSARSPARPTTSTRTTPRSCARRRTSSARAVVRAEQARELEALAAPARAARRAGPRRGRPRAPPGRRPPARRGPPAPALRAARAERPGGTSRRSASRPRWRRRARSCDGVDRRPAPGDAGPRRAQRRARDAAAEHAARAGIVAEVDVDAGAEGVHDRLVLSLARELLTNVVKHSGATRATLRVSGGAGGELAARGRRRRLRARRRRVRGRADPRQRRPRHRARARHGARRDDRGRRPASTAAAPASRSAFRAARRGRRSAGSGPGPAPPRRPPCRRRCGTLTSSPCPRRWGRCRRRTAPSASSWCRPTARRSRP